MHSLHLHQAFAMIVHVVFVIFSFIIFESLEAEVIG